MEMMVWGGEKLFGQRRQRPVAGFLIPVPDNAMIDTDGAALAPIETIVNFVNYLLSGGFYRLQ
ncbi:hypothetical protein CO661_24960 [Sinorhizobium fredii]|uniref:Uncharacterized protein n=1 Tax=Rhizobium fredii TaxID=380 RepID=A0A2A6LSJ4_RHIFR|nr:hypothetical protein CO661_24960 [Sinorhizobium fredii]